MDVSRQYIYKLVHSGKLRASRLSDKMSIIRQAYIELMLKTNPYEQLMPYTVPSYIRIDVPDEGDYNFHYEDETRLRVAV